MIIDTCERLSACAMRQSINVHCVHEYKKDADDLYQFQIVPPFYRATCKESYLLCAYDTTQICSFSVRDEVFMFTAGIFFLGRYKTHEFRVQNVQWTGITKLCLFDRAGELKALLKAVCITFACSFAHTFYVRFHNVFIVVCRI